MATVRKAPTLIKYAACAAYARGAGPRMTRRIVVLEQAHFCVEGLPAQHWELVVMDLNTRTGELFCQACAHLCALCSCVTSCCMRHGRQHKGRRALLPEVRVPPHLRSSIAQRAGAGMLLRD
jgi:hypothetical protein